MKIEPKNLEEELAGMKPRAPSELLRERITREMENPAARPSGPRWFSWVAGVAATLALLAALGLWLMRHAMQPVKAVAEPAEEEVLPPADPADLFELVDTRRDLVNARDEGVVMIDGYGPVQAYSYRALNHAEWANPHDGRRLAVTRPAEQLVFVRMKMD